jgi:uncharacterized protein YdhG (YjbR/CyaY superfamily)
MSWTRMCLALAERRPATKDPQSPTAIDKKSKGFTDEERDAMKEGAQELKAEAGRSRRAKKADGEGDVLAKIAEMPEPDRAMGERLHAIVKASAPALAPKTWYGMPAYAKDGKVVCFFQSAQKFKTRYATFGFSDKANLDDGAMWPTSFALKALTAADEARIAAREESGELRTEDRGDTDDDLGGREELPRCLHRHLQPRRHHDRGPVAVGPGGGYRRHDPRTRLAAEPAAPPWLSEGGDEFVAVGPSLRLRPNPDADASVNVRYDVGGHRLD